MFFPGWPRPPQQSTEKVHLRTCKVARAGLEQNALLPYTGKIPKYPRIFGSSFGAALCQHLQTLRVATSRGHRSSARCEALQHDGPATIPKCLADYAAACTAVLGLVPRKASVSSFLRKAARSRLRGCCGNCRGSRSSTLQINCQPSFAGPAPIRQVRSHPLQKKKKEQQLPHQLQLCGRAQNFASQRWISGTLQLGQRVARTCLSRVCCPDVHLRRLAALPLGPLPQVRGRRERRVLPHAPVLQPRLP
jgi:hypothetical protein